MQIPDKIVVGGKLIPIVLDSSLFEDDKYGSYSPKDGVIKIQPDMHEFQMKATLLHEVLHAVANFAGIKEEDKFDEEQFIGSIDNTLLMVMRDNSHLMEYLLSN